MANTFFRFKQFLVHHDRCAMKVTTDGCLFGAGCAEEMERTGGKGQHALDIGTGTGLLSLMVAQKNNIAIDAVEIDAAATEQATENVGGSPWKNQIAVVHTDVVQWPHTDQFDFIFANPPFYENDLPSGKSRKNVAHHDAGLTFVQLFVQLKKLLKDDGVFFPALVRKIANVTTGCYQALCVLFLLYDPGDGNHFTLNTKDQQERE